MKMKFGAIVVAGSGKIGGHVASKNRAGAYLRTKVTPSNPQTVSQSLVRGILSAVSSAWSQLTDIQRQGWNEAVADWTSTDIFGDIKKPSGFNLFVKLNSTLLGVGETILEEVPAKTELGDKLLTGAVIDVTAETITLTFLGATPAGNFNVITATPEMSQGISNAKNRFRDIDSFTGAPVPADLYTAYVSKFGVPNVGANVQLGLKIVGLNGQKTAESRVKATVE